MHTHTPAHTPPYVRAYTRTYRHTRTHTHTGCVSTLPSVPPRGNRCAHVPGSGGLRAESPGHRGLPRERRGPCCSRPTSPRPPVGLAAVEEEAEGLRPPSRAAQPAGWPGGPSSGPLGAGGPPAPRVPPKCTRQAVKKGSALHRSVTELLSQKVAPGGPPGRPEAKTAAQHGQFDSWSVNRPLTLNQKAPRTLAKTCHTKNIFLIY